MYCIFSNFGGYRNIFYTPTPLHQKIVFGGYKNDVTEMIHLLTFQSINNVLYFFKFGGGGSIQVFTNQTQKVDFLCNLSSDKKKVYISW